MPTYSIIIPTYNNFDLNLRCILSILKNSSSFKIEIIIIDNGSIDKTLAWAQKLHTQKIIRLVSNHSNMGFSHACNQGALIADGNYIIFLNNDTEVLPGWLQGLQNCFKSDLNIGIIGGKLLYPDNTIQHAGIAFDRQKVFHIYRHFHPSHPAVNRRREFQAVTGACLFVRRDLFITLGMFDEEFKNGFEDLDFCFRVRKNGLKVFYSPECSVIHHESKTPGRHIHHQQNAELFAHRWQDDITYDLEIIHAQDGLRQLQPGENSLPGKWFLDNNPNPFLHKARSFRDTGRFREAEDAYNCALRFNPFDLRRLDIAEELGDFYLDRNIPAAAQNCFEAIASISPSSQIKEKLKKTHRLLFSS
jgi:GT2 family glycosyltransferase